MYAYNGNKSLSGALTAYGAAYTSGDVIGVSFDAGAGTIEFFKNGVSQGVAFSASAGSYFPWVYTYSTGQSTTNFGQGGQPGQSNGRINAVVIDLGPSY